MHVAAGHFKWEKIKMDRVTMFRSPKHLFDFPELKAHMCFLRFYTCSEAVNMDASATCQLVF